jgi:hypothetical protein
LQRGIGKSIGMEQHQIRTDVQSQSTTEDQSRGGTTYGGQNERLREGQAAGTCVGFGFFLTEKGCSTF